MRPVIKTTNKSLSHLYISDLDGTLLCPRGSLTTYSRKQIVTMLKDRLPLSIATARSLLSVKQIFGDVDFELPIIHFNGAMVSDYHSGVHYHVCHFDTQMGGELLNFINHHLSHQPFLSTFDGEQDYLSYQEVGNDGYQWYFDDRVRAGDPRLRKVKDLRDLVKSENVICITVVDQVQPLVALKEKLEEEFGGKLKIRFFQNPYDHQWYWITIQPQLATKAEAIYKVLEQFGLSVQDLTVFGDHHNDVEMFRIAGRAIAVENAVPEIRQLSTHQIGHHANDSVVRFLLEDWQKNEFKKSD